MVGYFDKLSTSVFTRNEYKDIVLDSLRFCQKEKGLELVAWCIMTNHIHLIFRTIEGFKPEQVLGDIKRFPSKKIVCAIRENPRESRKENLLKVFKAAANKSSNVKDYQIWSHDNQPIELWSNKVIAQKVNYIHQNPVEAGYVNYAKDYIYSSAADYAGEKGLIDNIILAELNVY